MEITKRKYRVMNNQKFHLRKRCYFRLTNVPSNRILNLKLTLSIIVNKFRYFLYKFHRTKIYKYECYIRMNNN